MKKTAALALIALAACTGLTLSAQTYQEVAPKEPVLNDKKPVTTAEPPPPAAAPVADPQQVLVPNLVGLRLVPSTQDVTKAAFSDAGLVVQPGLEWMRRLPLHFVAGKYIGHPLTRGGLQRLAQEMVLVCRKSDHPVVDVFAPPQDISGGVVQLVVLAGRVGEMTAEGNRYFSSGLLLRQMRVRSGEVIQESRLLGDLDRLNQNPFRQVDLVYSRGAESGTTDVVLRVKDTRPERVYAGYEDSGNSVTGLGRILAGFNLGNLWGQDHQMAYQYTRSSDSNDIQAHSGSYTVLLPWHHTVSVFGDWAEAKADAGGLFTLDGVSYQVGMRYTVPLPLMHAYAHSLTLGWDYKWSNNNLSFGGTQVFTSPANIAQGVVAYSATRADRLGGTQGSITAFISPGGIGGENHDHNFATQRAGAPANYEYFQASLTRTQKLPNKYSLVLTAIGQYSPYRLLSSEQFGLGGANSVRGYDERFGNGDDGISGQLELRTPPHHFFGSLPDRTQFLVFIDGGRDWQHNGQANEIDYTMAGIGPGIRINFERYGAIKFDYGFQMKRIPGTRSGRPHVSAVISF